MRIGVIQASSQATKNKMLYNAVTKYAPKDSEVINFGCTLEEKENYSSSSDIMIFSRFTPTLTVKSIEL